MAGARFANFGSNDGSLAVSAVSGHIFSRAGGLLASLRLRRLTGGTGGAYMPPIQAGRNVRPL
jgi:hypothetical protein